MTAILAVATLLLTGCACTTPIQVIGLLGELSEAEERYRQELHAQAQQLQQQTQGESGAGTVLQGNTNAQTYDHENHAPGEVYSHTIMVYMVGSNLESEYGSATEDLGEMETACFDRSKHNVVVYTGGAREWQNDYVSGQGNALLISTEEGFEVSETAEADMGDPDTLAAFVDDCFEHYDTDLYSLILWDHGGGPVGGFGVDEKYNDVLSLEELSSAMQSAVGSKGRKLELIGFDACLMNSLEVADVFEPYANYLVASQETEPGWGWHYAFLSSLDEPDMDGAALGQSIIQHYFMYGEAVFEAFPRLYADLTLSCIDLRGYPTAEEELNRFFARVDGDLNADIFPKLVRARGQVRDFGSYSTSFDYGMVDAVHLLEQMQDTDADPGAAIEAIRNMVVYSETNAENACGISLCYPYESESEYTNAYIAIQSSMDIVSEYNSFLKDFYAIKNGDTLAGNWDVSDNKTEVNEVAPVLPGTQTQGYDISLALTPEQQQNFGSAGYYILRDARTGFLEDQNLERDDPAYLCVHGGKNAKMDENGVIHARYSNNAVYIRDMTTGELSDIPMILVDNDSSSGEKRYLSIVMLESFGDNLADWKMDNARLQIVVNEEYPNGIIRCAVPLDDSDETQGASKQLYDLDDYECMAVTSRVSYVTKDAQGNSMNFYDWEQTGWIVGFEQDLTNGYELQIMPIPDPENYVCMFYVKDAQGNVTYSDLIPLG